MKPSTDQAELVLGDSSQWISPVSTHPVGGVLGALCSRPAFQECLQPGREGRPPRGRGRPAPCPS